MYKVEIHPRACVVIRRYYITREAAEATVAMYYGVPFCKMEKISVLQALREIF